LSQQFALANFAPLGRFLAIMSVEERLNDLESRFTFLEAHVEEQDKVILELRDQLAGLKAVLRRLDDRLKETDTGEPPRSAADERPPHY
jgi:uncharacterized coiled-coil protein SlyX